MLLQKYPLLPQLPHHFCLLPELLLCSVLLHRHNQSSSLLPCSLLLLPFIVFSSFYLSFFILAVEFTFEIDINAAINILAEGLRQISIPAQHQACFFESHVPFSG
jgi:hypothetical protein